MIVGADDRVRLTAVVGDRSRPLKHVQRARVVLHSAERLPVLDVARRVGVSRPAVWRWQRRYAEEGIEGLLRDKTRPPGTPPLPTATVAQVLALACSEPPGETTHWTGRAVAEVVGISLRSVQRIWQGHRLQPHRIRTFKRSNDPAFAEKVEDIVGLYMDPPSHAVVLSIDEKSQIQALDRTQPGLPMKPGKCGTMTHDYKRNGTTTLFAALSVLDGAVIGRNMQRHRHQEFIRFLGAIERQVPAGDHREQRPHAEGVAGALRAHGGRAGARRGRGPAAGAAARRGRGAPGRRGPAVVGRRIPARRPGQAGVRGGCKGRGGAREGGKRRGTGRACGAHRLAAGRSA